MMKALLNFAKIAILGVAVCSPVLATAQEAAQTQQITQAQEINITPENYMGILHGCNAVGLESAGIAYMHQSHAPKEEIQARFDQFIGQIPNDASEENKASIQGLAGFWKSTIDDIYNLEIGQNNAEKIYIIDNVYLQSLQNCMIAELSQVRNVPFN